MSHAAFAVCIQSESLPLESEMEEDVQRAMSHADRFANAEHLLTVTASAVYVRIKAHPLTSELDTDVL